MDSDQVKDNLFANNGSKKKNIKFLHCVPACHPYYQHIISSTKYKKNILIKIFMNSINNEKIIIDIMVIVLTSIYKVRT